MESQPVDAFLRSEGVARLQRLRARVDAIEREIAGVTDLLLWCAAQTRTAEAAAAAGTQPPAGAPQLVDVGLKVFVPAVPDTAPPRLLVRAGVGVFVEMPLAEARAFASARLDALAAQRTAAVRALAQCTTLVLSLSHPPVHI